MTTDMPEAAERDEARTQLLTVLVERAVRTAQVEGQRAYAVARCYQPYPRKSWEELQQGLEQRHRLPASRSVRGTTPVQTLDLVLSVRFGFGGKGTKRGAHLRLSRLLVLDRAFAELGDGLRVEELVAATGMADNVVYNTVRWAQREGVLADEGEHGLYRCYVEPEPPSTVRVARAW